MATAVIILANGMEEIEALAPADILRRGGVRVTLAGLGAAEITGAHQIIVKTDGVLTEKIDLPDALILPGGMPGAKNLGDSPIVEKLTRAQFARGGIIAAICAAPALTLAKWGILDNQRATCYPGLETNFPASATYVDEPVVIAQKIITASGPSAAMAFGYQILAALINPAAAAKLQKDMLYK